MPEKRLELFVRHAQFVSGEDSKLITLHCARKVCEKFHLLKNKVMAGQIKNRFTPLF